MASTTPNRSYPYPDFGDTQNFPAQMQSFALAVDTDVYNSLSLPLEEARDEPSFKTMRSAVQAVAPNVNVTMTYDSVVYNNGTFTPGASSVIIGRPGVYLVAGSVALSPSGSAGGSAALVLASTGSMANPGAVSRALDNDKDTELSYLTLHYVPTAPETLSQFVRHNHAVSLNSATTQLTVTRIGI